MARFDLPLDQLRSYLPPRTEPADFDTFWQQTVAEARALTLDPQFERADFTPYSRSLLLRACGLGVRGRIHSQHNDP